MSYRRQRQKKIKSD